VIGKSAIIATASFSLTIKHLVSRKSTPLRKLEIPKFFTPTKLLRNTSENKNQIIKSERNPTK